MSILHTFHSNKNLWTMSFFFHGPDTVELFTICLLFSISIFFQASLNSSNLHIISKPPPPPTHTHTHVCVHACVCMQYAALHFCICSTYIYIYLHYTHVLRSEFGHVWLLTTSVYLLKLLYVNSFVARNLFILSIVCIYAFFASFCMAHCAPDLARFHAPHKCPLLLSHTHTHKHTNTHTLSLSLDLYNIKLSTYTGLSFF